MVQIRARNLLTPEQLHVYCMANIKPAAPRPPKAPPAPKPKKKQPYLYTTPHTPETRPKILDILPQERVLNSARARSGVRSTRNTTQQKPPKNPAWRRPLKPA